LIRRPLAVAAVLALLVAPQTFANGWLKTVAAAQKVAKEKKQLILVDMFAEWCGWCHRFEREVFPSKVFQDATTDIVLLRLDTEDRKEGTDMARKFSVTSLPTFLILTPDLELAGMIRGYAPPNQFVEQLDKNIANHAAFMKRVKDEHTYKKDYFKRLELARDFTTRLAFDKAEPRLKKLIEEKGVPAAVRDSAYYELALLYTTQDKYTNAEKTIRALLGVSKLGESVERSRLLLGQIYLQQGNLLGARNEFREFKQIFPNSPLMPNVDAVLPQLEKRLAGK
jgi:thioredoxin-related protein